MRLVEGVGERHVVDGATEVLRQRIQSAFRRPHELSLALLLFAQGLPTRRIVTIGAIRRPGS